MNILLVDDERLAVEVMNRMIDKEKYGFSTIYKALSMKQAQQICEETDIDIIICDIEMPRGSGLDFVQWLLDTLMELQKIGQVNRWILCSGFWIQVEIRLLFSLPVMRFFRMHSRQFP